MRRKEANSCKLSRFFASRPAGYLLRKTNVSLYLFSDIRSQSSAGWKTNVFGSEMTTGSMTADTEIAGLLTYFPGRTVLVLGDVMLDRYVAGEVSRISPEAPIPVLRVTGSRTVLGGAANVAHNVAALGARAILFGIIGADEAGGEVERLVREAGDNIDARLLAVSGRPTTVKTRFIRGSHQLLRVDDETADPLDANTATELARRVAQALTDSDIVVLSDYANYAIWCCGA